MTDESEVGMTTVHYPADVAKVMLLLARRQIIDADAVATALAEARADSQAQERARMVVFLKKLPCPTPATWAALIESVGSGEAWKSECDSNA